MQHKWISKFMGYDFSIEYKKGEENKVGDVFSSKQEEEDIVALAIIIFPTPTWIKEKESYYASPKM